MPPPLFPWPPVVELLDDLRDRIRAHYGAQLLDQYREQYLPAQGGIAVERRDRPAVDRL
jgi:hypothetical protein